jgi:hypothetical protein
MAGAELTKVEMLLKRLLNATMHDAVEWQTTDRPYTYECSFPAGSVMVSTEDGDGQSPYMFEVLDEDGSVLEDLRTTFIPTGAPASWNTELDRLYNRAHRKALDLDKKLDRIMENLPPLPDEEPPF